MSRRSRHIAITLCVLLPIIFVVAGYLVLASAVRSIEPTVTDDASMYGDYLDHWKPHGLAGHFPTAIPADATNVRIAHSTGPLQAGAYLQVRMTLPAEHVAEIESTAKQQATQQSVGGSKYEDVNRDAQNGMATTNFYTADEDRLVVEFPEHYTLYLLHAKKGSSGSWGHGETSGVAISTEASEVIYWTESW